ncbi:hypothetical protein C2G38_2149994 [Gigaspora rosea]|uniref:Uncharacterized protein n=1 Tax=Gigaspora rosea TaxID=44941 RepID=A0A397U092_9GLOM|nr:hypothetical protein C2G38_2149994 [Gigaspora rosea]
MASNNSMVFSFLSLEGFEKIITNYMNNRKNERYIMNRLKYNHCIKLLRNPNKNAVRQCKVCVTRCATKRMPAIKPIIAEKFLAHVQVSLYQYNSIDLENNYADNLLDETFQNYKSYDVLSQTDTILEGNMVKIRIPDIDKLKLDRRSLPCKIIQKKPESDMYQIGCKFGILDVWYSANELEPLGTNEYPALGIIPLGTSVSLRNAAA